MTQRSSTGHQVTLTDEPLRRYPRDASDGTFDRITAIAADLFPVPISIVSLVVVC
jgi:hypothetical protein